MWDVNRAAAFEKCRPGIAIMGANVNPNRIYDFGVGEAGVLEAGLCESYSARLFPFCNDDNLR